jgi:hypothetical protein
MIADLLDYTPVSSRRLDVQVFHKGQITATRPDGWSQRQAYSHELTPEEIRAMNLPHVVVHQLRSGLYYATLEKDGNPVPIPQTECYCYPSSRTTHEIEHALSDGFELYHITGGKSIVIKNGGNFLKGDSSNPRFRFDTRVDNNAPSLGYLLYFGRPVPEVPQYFFSVSLVYEQGRIKTELERYLCYPPTAKNQSMQSVISVTLHDDTIVRVSGRAENNNLLSEQAGAVLLAQPNEWLHVDPTDARAGILLEQLFEQDIRGKRVDLRELVAHIALEAKEGRPLRPQDMPVFFS